MRRSFASSSACVASRARCAWPASRAPRCNCRPSCAWRRSSVPSSVSSSMIRFFKRSTSALWRRSSRLLSSSCFSRWFSAFCCEMARSKLSTTCSSLPSLRLRVGGDPALEADGPAPAPVVVLGGASTMSSNSRIRPSRRDVLALACSRSKRSSMAWCSRSNSLSERSASALFLSSTSSSSLRFSRFRRMYSSSRCAQSSSEAAARARRRAKFRSAMARSFSSSCLRSPSESFRSFSSSWRASTSNLRRKSSNSFSVR
mmetsp:Transcript_24574/g.77345  ORF Transcript_24574/g.77345 Transcript_24574/m.77345 type:complete len:258 (+) Transcript_24574:768-1541(+)